MADMTEMIHMRYEELYKLVLEDRDIWECLDNVSTFNVLFKNFMRSLGIDNVLNIIRYEELDETKYADAKAGKIKELTDIELLISDFIRPNEDYLDTIACLIDAKRHIRQIDIMNNTPIKELSMKYNW